MRTCRICGGKFSYVTESHTKTHGISLDEYELLFAIENHPDFRCQYESSRSLGSCNLKADRDSDNQFCILHRLGPKKDIKKFTASLAAFLKTKVHAKSDIILDRVHFPTTFQLRNQIIENKLVISNSEFYGNIDFSQTVFQKKVSFKQCTINGNAIFEGAKFLSGADFHESKFVGEVTYEDAGFEQKAGFWKTEFHNNSTFLRTKFCEDAVFMTCVFPAPPYYIRFMNTFFTKPQLVLFTDIDVSGTLFRWTDLTEVRFENIKWPYTPKIWGARRYIADEFFDWNRDKKALFVSRRRIL